MLLMPPVLFGVSLIRMTGTKPENWMIPDMFNISEDKPCILFKNIVSHVQFPDHMGGPLINGWDFHIIPVENGQVSIIFLWNRKAVAFKINFHEFRQEFLWNMPVLIASFYPILDADAFGSAIFGIEVMDPFTDRAPG